jgi:hypothetical protein
MSNSNNYNEDNDPGEKMHRRVSPFDAPWMKHTDSDAETDYPRKLADSYIQNRLPAVGMTTSEEIKRDFKDFWNVDDEAVASQAIREMVADPRTEAAFRDFNSNTKSFSYYVKYKRE